MINNIQPRLKQIADVLQRENLDFDELKVALDDYKTIVYGVSSLEFEDDALRNDIHSENGMALGTAWAAMCLDDGMRTKMFVKGLIEAVETKLNESKKPVHILYAGTVDRLQLLFFRFWRSIPKMKWFVPCLRLMK